MNNYRIDMGNITRVIKSHMTNSFHLSPDTMFLTSFNLNIYKNILTQRTRKISILSDIKMFFKYNVSGRGNDVISRSRGIFNICSPL